MRFFWITICVIAYLFFTSSQIRAAVFDVKSANELHEALKEAGKNGENDYIKIYEGTYYGNFVFLQSVSEEDKSITISGGFVGEEECTYNPANTILDGGGEDRVLYCVVTGSIIIMHLTFQNGNINEGPGGGIAVTHHPIDKPGSILIYDNIIRNNQSKMGGGLFAESNAGKTTAGNIWLQSNKILNNTTTGIWGGGGAYLYVITGSISKNTGQILVVNNTISENSATDSNSGGGMYVLSKSNTGPAGKITLLLNTINGNNAGNSVHDNGGGVFIESKSAVGLAVSDVSGLNSITLQENTIENNSVGAQGGGIFINATAEEGTSPAIIFEKNTISSNSASIRGGGVRALTNSPGGVGGNITFNGNIVFQNIVGSTDDNGQAGGIRLSSDGGLAGKVILTNNIIAENTSNYFDGGAAITGNITLTNNTIANNEAIQNGGGIFLLGNSSVRAYNNIIWSNSPRDIQLGGAGTVESHNNDYTSIAGSWLTETDRMNADPLFVGSGDYHLQSASPCINGGTATALGLPAEDFDGDLRTIGGVPDIGADEYKYFFIPIWFPDQSFFRILPPELQRHIRSVKRLDRRE